MSTSYTGQRQSCGFKFRRMVNADILKGPISYLLAFLVIGLGFDNIAVGASKGSNTRTRPSANGGAPPSKEAAKNSGFAAFVNSDKANAENCDGTNCDASAGSTSPANNGPTRSAWALSDLLDRALIASIKETIAVEFDAEVMEEIVALESNSKGIDRGNPGNDILLDYSVNMLAAKLYKKYIDVILKKTSRQSQLALEVWSRDVHKKLPKKYPLDLSFHIEYLPSLMMLHSQLSAREGNTVVHGRVLSLIKSQMRNWIYVRSPQIRDVLAEKEIEIAGKKKGSLGIVEGTRTDMLLPGLKAGLTPVELIIPDVTLEQLIAESPANLRFQKTVAFARHFSAQTVLFNIPLFWVTLAQVGMDYAKNPNAISDFFRSLEDPASHVGFAAFIATNHKLAAAWMHMTNPRWHFLGPQLGMAMGMTASSVISGFWHDPDIKACANSYLKDHGACQKAYNNWVPTGKINELAPKIAGLLSTAIISGYTTKGIGNAVSLAGAATVVTAGAVNNGVGNLSAALPERFGVRLAELHILTQRAFQGEKLEEYLSKLRKLKNLVAGPIMNIAGNLVFLAVDPFISEPIQHQYQTLKQTSFDLAQFLELNTPLGNFENFGRFIWFDNVKLPHELSDKTLPQVNSSLNQATDAFLATGFQLIDPKQCLPKAEVPKLVITSDVGFTAANVRGVRTTQPQCYLYIVKDKEQVLHNAFAQIREKMPKPKESGEDKSVAATIPDVPLHIAYRDKNYGYSIGGKSAPKKFGDGVIMKVSLDVDRLEVIVCEGQQAKELAAVSMPRNWYGTKNQKFEGLRECLETADLPFWINKYSEVQRDWRSHLMMDTVNASLQWSSTIGDFLTMFNGSRAFYEYVINGIWEHRRFAVDVEQGPGSDEEKKQKIAEHREQLYTRLMKRSELLKVAFDATKVPAMRAHSELVTVDGKSEKKIIVPARNEEQKEKFADLYPSMMGGFQITELSDYLLTSMVCGPRAEDQPTAFQKMKSLKWLNWESIAAVAPSFFTTVRLVEPISPLLDLAPGMRFELLPPRITDKNEACDSKNWVTTKNKIPKATVLGDSEDLTIETSPITGMMKSVVPESLQNKVSQFGTAVKEKLSQWGEKIAASTDENHSTRYGQKVRQGLDDIGKNPAEKWQDKSAPIYWQQIKIGDKTYRGIVDYLIDNARNDILRPHDEFKNGFVNWFRTVVEDPLADPNRGLWKDVRQNYDSLLQNHFIPALKNTKMAVECGDGSDISCGLYSSEYLQADGIVKAATIEIQTYLRILNRIAKRLVGKDENDEVLKKVEGAQSELIMKLRNLRGTIQDFDLEEVSGALQNINKVYLESIEAKLQAPTAPESAVSGKEFLEAPDGKPLSFPSNQSVASTSEKDPKGANPPPVPLEQIFDFGGLGTVVDSLFQKIGGVLEELASYKKYTKTMDLDKKASEIQNGTVAPARGGAAPWAR